ncbi:MAG: tetraacyldisaccharide 4'-kinase, partial [bacterium]
EKIQEIRRATAVLLMRASVPGPIPLSQTKKHFAENFPEIPVFEVEVQPANWQFRPGDRILAVSGIANPHNFETLLKMQGVVVIPMRFPDHYMYTSSDVRRIVRLAEKMQVDNIVTTEKDFVKLKAFTARIFPLTVQVKIHPEALWKQFWQDLFSGK